MPVCTFETVCYIFSRLHTSDSLLCRLLSDEQSITFNILLIVEQLIININIISKSAFKKTKKDQPRWKDVG
jgi:hypothetical protein